MFSHRQVIYDELIYPRGVSHFCHVWIIFRKRALFNPKCWFRMTLKTQNNDPENDIEWLKERLCSCENNYLEKDVERGESLGDSGFLETLLEFPSLDAHWSQFWKLIKICLVPWDIHMAWEIFKVSLLS